MKTDRSLIGLYIHIPFCERKCPYCDFNTYAGLEGFFDETIEAISMELAQWQEPLDGRLIQTIYLGGGTPTILSVSQLTQIFDTIHHCFQVDSSCEVTCEANPGAVDREKFRGLIELGVNRLSIGVQSLQPDELRFLGRIHNVDDVYYAFDFARDAGFRNINLDFMFGLPDQSLERWANSLEQAFALDPEHMSLYSLIVEPNTPLNHWVQSGVVQPPDEDSAAEQYEYAMEQLANGGYYQYEVSNWSKTPDLICQHNMFYWRNQEYIGVGPGAHSHLRQQNSNNNSTKNWRWGNRKPVAGYIRRIQQGESVVEFCEELMPETAMGETMMLGLRLLHEGVPLKHFRHLHGQNLETVFADEIELLRSSDLLMMDSDQVQLTLKGLMMGNQVFAHFLPTH
ncbi:radical SAM family heme chaperone HemW [Chloroflexi bacterium TSY]|nr:radical SAM family heme chaperone HemW [Chloroflexi bacterium TSY]